MGYFNQLKQFLTQAKTDNLKTKHYDSEYKGTKVRVSFGQGTPAHIPWISFLKEPNTTSNGIYPVYLYYKEFDILILAYGVSETNEPRDSWHIQDEKSIKQYFEENFDQKPHRYGESYIFKTYDANDLPSKEEIDRDLDILIDQYLNHEVNQGQKKSNLKSDGTFELNPLFEDLEDSGLLYSNQLIIRFAASLLTKPFVILTGLSGSGKTKLAQAFVQWMCEDETQYRIVPVGADWTNREPLLGYPNALQPEEYVKPDNGVLDLINQANNKPELPHFLILDEMNLSHVERYFADFLSVMESNDEIHLHSESKVKNGVPAKLKIPTNLYVIGTVNIDETTNMFSPKVLDRANTIEFHITASEMQEFLVGIKDINMEALNTKGAGKAKSFLEMSTNRSFDTPDIEDINKILIHFFEELKKIGAEFGYRSASEILRLYNQLTQLDNSLSSTERIDIAIMQKLLPKLHGSRRKLCPVLESLGKLCVKENEKIVSDIFENQDYDFHNDSVLYPISLEKIARMYRGAVDNGFASYAEA